MPQNNLGQNNFGDIIIRRNACTVKYVIHTVTNMLINSFVVSEDDFSWICDYSWVCLQSSYRKDKSDLSVAFVPKSDA